MDLPQACNRRHLFQLTFYILSLVYELTEIIKYVNNITIYL